MRTPFSNFDGGLVRTKINTEGFKILDPWKVLKLRELLFRKKSRSAIKKCYSDIEHPDLPHHQNVQPSFSLVFGFDPEGTMNEVRASQKRKDIRVEWKMTR